MSQVEETDPEIDAHDDCQDAGDGGEERQLEGASKGAAAVPGFEDGHGQAHGDGRHIKEDRQNRAVPQRVELLGDDEEEAAE